MSLEERINAAIKDAMRAKDRVALDSLRAVKNQLLLLKTESKDAEVSEKEEIALLQRLIKQRKEAAAQFEANGRQDLADKEVAQVAIIEPFLPEQMTDEALEKSIKEIIDETGAESMKDMGKVMGVAQQKLMGKADGKSISTKVKELLS